MRRFLNAAEVNIAQNGGMPSRFPESGADENCAEIWSFPIRTKKNTHIANPRKHTAARGKHKNYGPLLPETHSEDTFVIKKDIARENFRILENLFIIYHTKTLFEEFPQHFLSKLLNLSFYFHSIYLLGTNNPIHPTIGDYFRRLVKEFSVRGRKTICTMLSDRCFQLIERKKIIQKNN